MEALPVACKGQIITRIEVHTRPPFEITGSKVQQRLARRVTRLHATTNPEVIRRFLALQPGEPCSELRRSESERILRAQPFLAAASVLVLPEENGTVYVSVQTVDEVSLILGGGGSSKAPYLRGFRIGEANLMGEAMSLAADWRYNRDFPDAFGVRFADYQLAGRPYQLHLDASRRELGNDWGIDASHPFFTDLQRISWRTSAASRKSYARFRRLDGTSLLLPFGREYGDIGGLVRIGPPGRIALVGASLSYERELPGGLPVILLDSTRRFEPQPDSTLSGRFKIHRATRFNLLLGLRDVKYMPVTGFESLDGYQDMRKGVELTSLIGNGMEILGGTENDMFVAADLYAGAGTPRAFGGIEVRGEGRKAQDGAEWDGLLASGRAAVYLKPATRNTILADVEWTAGWRERIPFQLAFGDRDGGPLGYRSSYLAGARRLVTRVEDRIYLGRLKQFASIGVAPFVNTGELWAGDAPFGSTTGVKLSTGISLLASVPPKSQRLWRLDVAIPIHPEYGAKWQLRLTSQNFTRMFWKEPNDIARNRERAVPTSIFNWP
ncbi:MAG: hypothetical protein ABI875_00285 [Gemmatimonadales bacterium]